MRKPQNVLQGPALYNIYKFFVRPHLDFGEIIYDQVFNNSFHYELERIQYNAGLTGIYEAHQKKIFTRN